MCDWPSPSNAVHDAGGFYIADEVQAGFFRTGTWWGYESLGVAPDLVTFGKPMGGGMPVAAVAGPRVVFSDFGGQQRYFNTFAGTPGADRRRTHGAQRAARRRLR